MAADQEPTIADDGVQEVPLTIARPLLTRLIEQVREDGLVSALTIRGRRRAYLVTPDFYERAQRADHTAKALLRFLDEEPGAAGAKMRENAMRYIREFGQDPDDA
jgi:PHD/YefM family antitoxin component YafN of YafNO toxin-antitoxin module